MNPVTLIVAPLVLGAVAAFGFAPPLVVEPLHELLTSLTAPGWLVGVLVFAWLWVVIE